MKTEKKQQNYLFILSLIMLSLALFLLIGADSYVLFDDSGTYMMMVNGEGVMPLYPLFLFFNRLLWGTNRYLQAVVVEQAFVATACIIWFVMEIKRRFCLRYAESYLVYLLAAFPFTTDMPMAMTTQEILTEGLTYALFYIFVIFLFGAILDKDWKKWLSSFVFVYLLALLRSQLQILFAVCGAALIYISFMKYERKKILPVLGRLFVSLLLCCMVMGTGVLGVIRLNAACQRAMFGNGALAELIRENQMTEEDVTSLDPAANSEMEMNDETEIRDGLKNVQEKVIAEESSQEDRPAPNTHPEVVAFMNQEYEDSGTSISQYDSLIFSKAMYEADYEDYLLFEDESVREQFLLVYQVVDDLKCRYPYADSGLWGWKNISDSAGKIGPACFSTLNGYFGEYYNTTVVYFQYQRTAQAFRTIGRKLLIHHFGSFLLHTLRLMVPAFVATVFFQKEQFYLLCHLVTLFLYVSAIALMIWGYVDKKVDRKYAEYMLGVMLTDFILVIVISLVFIGLQRYLVYAFGIFYVAYLLLLKQFWQLHGKQWFQTKMRHLYEKK